MTECTADTIQRKTDESVILLLSTCQSSHLTGTFHSVNLIGFYMEPTLSRSQEFTSCWTVSSDTRGDENRHLILIFWFLQCHA